MFALAANLVVVPAIANTLALKDFAAEVMKTVADHPIGYLIDMDYGIAFYSRRTIPIVSVQGTEQTRIPGVLGQYLGAAPAAFRAEYQVIMTSNPTELDGSGRLLLLQKVGAPAKPPTSDGNV